MKVVLLQNPSSSFLLDPINKDITSHLTKYNSKHSVTFRQMKIKLKAMVIISILTRLNTFS